MLDSNQALQTLKAKAMLLIRREREVYALRLERERMMAWLHGFQQLSLQADPENGFAMCEVWARVMVERLHFQTSAAFLYDAGTGELALIHGKSHAPLPARIRLAEAPMRVLRERREGSFERNGDPEVAALAGALGLQRFLWFVFSRESDEHVLLVAGVAAGLSGAQVATLEGDLIHFVMLGRHIEVLLRNASLIRELDAANRSLRELFEHMRQGILTFDANGRIGHIASQKTREFFGAADLEKATIREVLFPGAPEYDVNANAFSEWTQMVFTASAGDWELCEAHAPREVFMSSGGSEPRALELEFRPLLREGHIAELMLLATDVSVARKLESAMRAHQEEDTRRLAAMRRLITGGPQVFLAFVESSRDHIARCEAALERHSCELPTSVIDELFRHMHTLRGESRAFDLVELEGATRRVEEELNELRRLARGAGHVLTGSCVARLQIGFELVRRAIDLSCNMLAAASPLGELVFDQTTVSRSLLSELGQLARGRDDEVSALVARLAAVPFGVTAAGVMEGAPSWAALEGVSVALEVRAREVLVPEGLARVLPGVLAHLVRNAIAHGIESSDERAAGGKPERGSIVLRAATISKGVRIDVVDDGRGLRVGELNARAFGTANSTLEACELVFVPGISTRETRDALAGMGVGLDAVRSELLPLGYGVRLSFVAGQGTTVTIAPLASLSSAETTNKEAGIS